MLPTVSVIVLNYNGLAYMENCFASLSRLDYPPDRLELVLADNGSHDDSVAYVRQHFPQVRIIQFDRNYGFCEGNNRAAAQLSHEFVAFLNSDMRVEAAWLSGLVEAMADEPGVICTASKILNWDGQLMDFGGILLSFLGHGRAEGYHDPNLTAYDQRRYILAPCGGAMLIHRQIFLDIGGFDEAYFAYFEDIDLGWRLWILGYQVVFAPKSICYHIHSGSSSKQSPAKIHYLYERNALYTIIKNYEPAYLERVLSLALLMQFKRTYLYAQQNGLDPQQYRFNVATPAPVSVNKEIYNTRYYLREMWRILKEDGGLALARKVIDELERRRGRPVPTLKEPPKGYSEISQACLVAVNDVMENYGAVLQKRDYIQKHRRRSDKEIFTLIRSLSFDVCFDSPEYRHTQQQLMEHLAIKSLFGEIFNSDVPFAL